MKRKNTEKLNNVIYQYLRENGLETPLNEFRATQAWSSPFSSIPARIKQLLSNASGRSVDVRIHTAGIGLPILVKKLLSSGRVPLSDTTAKACICRQL